MHKLKDYFLKNFEQIFVFIILGSVGFINYFVPYKLAFLNFYFIPVLLTAYYLDVRRALLGAFLCIILVGFFFYRDPASFFPGTENMDIALNIVTWAGFLILSGAIVGSLNHKLQEELRQSTTLTSQLTDAQIKTAETNKMLGISFQGQGLLDLAFDKFQSCPMDDQLKNLLYNLGLDFERKRHYNKASSVYEYIARTDPGYKDVKTKLESLKNASQGATGGGLGQQSLLGRRISDAPTTTLPTLGRYEIERELGRGAMGIVYLGRDPKINRPVAIKTMALDLSMGPAELEATKERFFREAESAGALNHPNIVRIFDAGEESDVCYITMELLEGHDLSRYTAKDNLLPIDYTLEYIAQVATALDSAHAQGVVHPDIKPANLMVLNDGTIRVADFGIARVASASRTSTGTIMGTPAYMSPEQVAGQKVDGRADFFSLGVVLFELLTGTRPFEEGDGVGAITILFRIANSPEPEPMDINAAIPPAVSAIIHKMLKKNPPERYARGLEIAEELRAAADAFRATTATEAPR